MQVAGTSGHRVKLEDIEKAYATTRAAAAATWDKFINAKIEEGSEVPKYPILKYALGDSSAGAAPADAAAPATPARPEKAAAAPYTPQSYEDALALTDFMKSFVAMLQAGFRLIKHDAGARRSHVVTLSEDCRVISWTPAAGAPALDSYYVGGFRVAELPGGHGDACFALSFPAAVYVPGVVKPEKALVVFETVNAATRDGARR